MRLTIVGNVGLLFVGAVLFLNGVMPLGRVEAKSAAPINFFVGVLQVVTPTYLSFAANGDADVILAAAGLFLWALFFLVLGLKRDGLTRCTGAVCAIQGWVTERSPAFLLLTGHSLRRNRPPAACRPAARADGHDQR